MIKLLTILLTSFKMALQELRVNTLRTFLSLFGITIGIFCIIGVLATVDSLERKVQGDIKSLGTNTIWIDKFDYGQGGGPDYPWWKYQGRPVNKIKDMEILQANTQLASNMAYFTPSSESIIYENNTLSGISMYGITEDFSKIQDLKIAQGRYLTESEFQHGTPNCVIGYDNAENLFGNPGLAIGKQIKVAGRKLNIVGLLEKQGSSFIGFQFDGCLLVPYRFFASIYNPSNTGQNLIIVQAKDGIPTTALADELRGNMRQIRKLSPKQEDNFSLNDMKQLGNATQSFFGSVNLGGWAIAGLSLIVGAFGVANIMFVTVRERTSQIGLKKAIGAKSKTILTEFLIESAFLCVMGGLIGLLLVWVLSLALTTVLPFPIYISPNIVIMAMSICIFLGILSGIIPATIASKMNPVDAIRSR